MTAHKDDQKATDVGAEALGDEALDQAQGGMTTGMSIASDSRAHLLRYHGLFAPDAHHRPLIVPPRPEPETTRHACTDPPLSAPTAPMSWMARLKRVFELEVSRCPKCGGELRVIATVTEPHVIARILEHLDWREHHTPALRGPPLHRVG